MATTLSPLLTDLHPPERRVLHEQVLAQLLDALRHGRLRPGDRLLEAEIAGRLGLSRGAVREAVRRLDRADRHLLREHLLNGLTIDQLGAVLGIHRATAARRIARAEHVGSRRVAPAVAMRQEALDGGAVRQQWTVGAADGRGGNRIRGHGREGFVISRA